MGTNKKVSTVKQWKIIFNSGDSDVRDKSGLIVVNS